MRSMKYQQYKQHTNIHKNTSDSNKNKFMNKKVTNKDDTYTYLGTCWKCNEFGHINKECKNSPFNTNQTDHIMQEQTMINTCWTHATLHSVSQIKFHQQHYQF